MGAVAGTVLTGQAIDHLEDGDASEGEHPVLSGVTPAARCDGRVVALEIFGQDVRIQDRFRRHLRALEAAGWGASLRIGMGDELVEQGSIFRASEQPQALFGGGGGGSCGFASGRELGDRAIDQFLNRADLAGANGFINSPLLVGCDEWSWQPPAGQIAHPIHPS